MICRNCGNQFPDDSAFCPYCGKRAIAETYYNDEQPQQRPISGLCVAGFVVSIVSWFLSLFGVVPALGLVLSIVGINVANKSNQRLKGLGIAGAIISGVALIYTIYNLIVLDALLSALSF